MPAFDVFLSHNSKEKEEVLRLARELKSRGISVWLDVWQLRPGTDWQAHLEEIVATCKSAIVCLGSSGVGPWEDPEMKALLRRFVNDKKSGELLPIIPVLLPGAAGNARLPAFLETFHAVDLRGGLSREGLDKLQWGITGKRPESLLMSDSAAETKKRSSGWIRALVLLCLIALAGYFGVKYADQRWPNWHGIIKSSPQPTTSDQRVVADEHLNYTFSPEDFPFVPGSEGGALASIKIESEPTIGGLSLPGIGVIIGQQVSAEEIAQGKLMWRGSIDPTSQQFPPASFSFRVNDGEHLSETASTFTIDYASSRFVGSWKPVDPSETTRLVIRRLADKLTIDILDSSSPNPKISLTTITQDATDGQLTLANDTETMVQRYHLSLGTEDILMVSGESGNKETLARIGTALFVLGQFEREN